MIVEKISLFSGKVNRMELDITEQQLQQWHNGQLVQRAFPHLTATEREFLLTGMSEEEQEEVFKSEYHDEKDFDADYYLRQDDEPAF